MGKNLYIADWHYDHKNILAFDNRPFKTINEMNEQLVNRWNCVVERSDRVYILGDMFWSNMNAAIEVLDKLNGEKYLIKGNHDRCNDSRFKRKFTKICDYDEINDCGRNVVLCHYPIPYFKNHFYGWYHLYGHVHDSFEAKMAEHDRYLMENLYEHQCNMYNVGAMISYMDYYPRTLDEIIGGYNEQRAKTSVGKESKTSGDD